jgi:cytochrome c oxidase cbb3-type subunit III
MIRKNAIRQNGARLLLPGLLLFVITRCLGAAEQAETGEAIFDRACASCHGAGGVGGRGPSLRGQLRNGNQAADIRGVILNGLPGTGMPKFHFDDDELRVLVPYIQSLSRGGELQGNSQNTGDKTAGRRIYESSGCSTCHKIGTEGSAVGPNLTRVGASRSYEYLKTSILDPSSDIPENYQTVTIVTRDGKRIQGLRVNEDSFTIQLRLRDQSFASFDKQAIAEETVEKASMMPPYKLNNKDLQDVLAYLSSLVGSADSGTQSKEERR